MRLAVFGANGPTGRLVVRQSLAAGHHVNASTRKPGEFPLSSPLLSVIAADVTDPAGVERTLSGAQAVISTYGVPYGRKPITVYSAGIATITQAMVKLGVRRLVCVTSTTLATEHAPGEPLVWRRVVKPLLRNVLGRTLYDDMDRMEAIVRATDLDWTIVRPAGLFNADQPSGEYEVAARHLLGSFTSRADLAQVLIDEAVEARHRRAVIEVITRSGHPPASNFLKEAFGRR